MNTEIRTVSSDLAPAVRPLRTRRWLRRGLLFLMSMFFVVNVLAFLQAWGMTHFPDRSNHTPPPEAMMTAGKIYVMLTGVEVPRSYNQTTPADWGLVFSTSHVRETNGIDLETWVIPGGAGAGQIEKIDWHRIDGKTVQQVRDYHHQIMHAKVDPNTVGGDVHELLITPEKWEWTLPRGRRPR